MNIAIVGTGYVGLVSGTCFADTGANVTCVDVDKDKIERLQRGDIPIYEPGLDELVVKNVKAGRLKFTTSLAEVLNDQQIIFSAVLLLQISLLNIQKRLSKNSIWMIQNVPIRSAESSMLEIFNV